MVSLFRSGARRSDPTVCGVVETMQRPCRDHAQPCQSGHPQGGWQYGLCYVQRPCTATLQPLRDQPCTRLTLHHAVTRCLAA